MSIFVRVFHPGQGGGIHSRANLDPLDRVDGHHRGGEFRVQLGINRRANACGQPLGHHFDGGANGVCHRGAWRPAPWPNLRRLVHRAPRTGCARSLTQRTGRGQYGAAPSAPCKPVYAGRAKAGPAPRAPRRPPPPAPPFRAQRTGHPRAGHAARIFLVICYVGMAGAERVGDIAVILAALIHVADHQLNRRAGGAALVNPRQNFHPRRVRAAALCAGSAPVYACPAIAGSWLHPAPHPAGNHRLSPPRQAHGFRPMWSRETNGRMC